MHFVPRQERVRLEGYTDQAAFGSEVDTCDRNR